MWRELLKGDIKTVLKLRRALVMDSDPDFLVMSAARIKKICSKCQVDNYDPVTMGKPDKLFPWQIYDIIIIDYYLGGKFNAIDLLSEVPPEKRPPTIMLTGRGSESIAVQALHSGFDYYLKKGSFSLRDFEEAITLAVEHRQGQLVKDTIEATPTNVMNGAVNLRPVQQDQPKPVDQHEKNHLTDKGAFFERLEALGVQCENDHYFALIALEDEDDKAKILVSAAPLQQDFSHHVRQFFKGSGQTCLMTYYQNNYLALLFHAAKPLTQLRELRVHIESFLDDINKETANEHNFSIGAIKCIENQNVYDYFTLGSTLCKYAKFEKDGICLYKHHYASTFLPTGKGQSGGEAEELFDFDFEAASNDGRVEFNFQSWLLTEGINEEESVIQDEFFDVRVKLKDPEGIYLERDDLIQCFKNELISPKIDKWVLRGAVSLLKQFKEDTDAANHGVYLCVKLSAGTLSDTHFYPWFKMLLASASLESPKLIFEFDTYDCIAHETKLLDLIELIKKNFDIATMLSGMHYIDQYRNVSNKLSFDFIKVDINHINNLSHEEILSWLSEIRAKGDRVICSGLQSADTLTYAMRLPFDYLQGYLIQKPSLKTFQVNMDWLQQ